jgi:copper transport protein
VSAVERNGYRVELRVDPNRAAVPNRFDLRITRDGRPVTGAKVTAGFAMLDMEMGEQSYPLPETAAGVYSRKAPALVMVGRWGLSFAIAPPGDDPFTVELVDHAAG